MRNPYDWIGRIGLLLAVVGAVNWLLVGLFEWNLVAWIFADSATQTVTTGERIVYIVVGVGGLIALPMLAATLARPGRREVATEDRGRDRSELNRDDTDFYLGGSKEGTEPAPVPRSARADERPVQTRDRPLRSVEPAPGPAGGTDASSARSRREDRLGHGAVEETGEGIGEDAEGGRRAS